MRRLTQEELAHLSLLGDRSPWPVMEFGRDGEVLYANAAALAAGEQQGVVDLRVFLPADLEKPASGPDDSAAAHVLHEIAVGERVYDATVHVSSDRERVLVYALDITERKVVEDALRLTQLSVDRAADLVHWITPDGDLLYVSDANCRRHGYSRDEMLGMTVFDIDPLMTREAWCDHWQDLKEHGSLRFETAHRAKDGEVFPVEVTANFVEHNGKEYDFAFARDISRRKKAEEDLRIAKEEVEAANRDLERAALRANQFTAHDADLADLAQRRDRELQALLRVAAALTSGGDVDAMLAEVAGALLEGLAVYWCGAYLYDAEAGQLRLAAHACIEVESSVWQPLLSLTDVPAMGDAVLQDRLVALYDDDTQPQPTDIADMRRCGDLCQLYVPMAYGDQVVGLLYLGEPREFRRFSEEDLRLVMAFAAQSALAIHLSRV